MGAAARGGPRGGALRASSGKFGAAQEYCQGRTVAAWLNLVRAGDVCCVESRKYCEEFELWLAGCRHISTSKLGTGISTKKLRVC